MTVLTAIRYNEGIIVGADRLVVLEKGQRVDASKLIFRKNYGIGLTGRTTAQFNLFERHNRFWNKLDDFLSEQKSYSGALEVFSDFFSSINLGLKQTEFTRNISNLAGSREIQQYNLQMSFLCVLRFKDKTHFHFDLGMENKGQVSCRRSIITTPEKIDFSEEYTKSRYVAYDKVFQRIKSANEAYPNFCGGMEIVDFNLENTKLLYLEHIN